MRVMMKIRICPLIQVSVPTIASIHVVSLFRANTLPPKEAFCSNHPEVTLKVISMKGVINIGNTLGPYCYHDLSLRTDVLLLTCVFANLGGLCFEKDPLVTSEKKVGDD